MRVAVIDTRTCNTGSMVRALTRHGASVRATTKPVDVVGADAVVLPGVGAAEPVMRHLSECGLAEVLVNAPVPMLGVCLGMQLMHMATEETALAEHFAVNPQHPLAVRPAPLPTLGLLPGVVTQMPARVGVRVPHMGWNDLCTAEGAYAADVLGVTSGDYVYFANSYAAGPHEYTTATFTHGQTYAAVVRREHVFGTQFHPERSGEVGDRVLKHFLSFVDEVR